MPPQSSDDGLPLLSVALPTLFSELRASLVGIQEAELTSQLDNARIHAYCDCTEETCLSFYLSQLVNEPCPGDYRVVTPPAVVTVGVCAGEIDLVEDHALRGDAGDRARLEEYGALKELVAGASPA